MQDPSTKTAGVFIGFCLFSLAMIVCLCAGFALTWGRNCKSCDDTLPHVALQLCVPAQFASPDGLWRKASASAARSGAGLLSVSGHHSTSSALGT
jgi:hypothetical protein